MNLRTDAITFGSLDTTDASRLRSGEVVDAFAEPMTARMWGARTLA